MKSTKPMGKMPGIKPLGKILILLLAACLFIYLYRHINDSDSLGSVGEKGLLGRPLRVGVVFWPGYAGGIVANNGFAPNKSCLFWNHKLQVEFVDIEDPDQLSAAFTKGGPEGIDIMWSTVDSWANSDVGLAKSGVKARAIMQVDWSRGGDAIVADNSIQRIEDLQGKKVALIQFTPSHWLLEYNLVNSSLSEADRRVIETGLVNSKDQAAGRDAFVSGQVPAAVLWEPTVSEALKKPNSHILLSTATNTNSIADIMIAKEDFIQAHPDVLQAFVDGWMEGATEANRDKAKAVKVLMDNEPSYKAAGEAATRDGLSKVHLAMPTDNTGMFGLDGKPSDWDRIFTLASERWLSLGVIPKTLVPAETMDARFVRVNYEKNDRPPRPIEHPIPPPPNGGTWIVKSSYAVGFATNSATMDGAAATVVDQKILTYAQNNGNARLIIEGHTDNVGDPHRNLELSWRRAQSIVDRLVANGISSSRLKALGKGDTQPAWNNRSAEGRKLNRRVVVRLSVWERR